jgi:ankyrin repeat protein
MKRLALACVLALSLGSCGIYDKKVYELGVAARDGMLDDVERLLSAGVDVNGCLGYEGCDKPIDLASAGGHLAVVQNLVDHGARVNDAPVNAVYRAARAGKADVVRYLLSKGGHLVCDEDNLPALKRDMAAAGWTDLEEQLEVTRVAPQP